MAAVELTEGLRTLRRRRKELSIGPRSRSSHLALLHRKPGSVTSLSRGEPVDSVARPQPPKPRARGSVLPADSRSRRRMPVATAMRDSPGSSERDPLVAKHSSVCACSVAIGIAGVATDVGTDAIVRSDDRRRPEAGGSCSSRPPKTPIAAAQRCRRAWVLQRRSSEERRRCEDSPSPSSAAADGPPSDQAPTAPAHRGGRRCDDAHPRRSGEDDSAAPLPDRAAGRVQLRGCGRAIARPVAAPTRSAAEP